MTPVIFPLSALLIIILCSSVSSSMVEMNHTRQNNNDLVVTDFAKIKQDGTNLQNIRNSTELDANSTSECNSHTQNISKCQDVVISGEAPHIFETFDILIVLKGAPGQSISCKADGNPFPEIRWFFNQQNLTNESSIIQVEKDNSSYLIFPTMEESHAGSYRCNAENKFGESETTITVEVLDDNKLAPICIKAEEYKEKEDRKVSETETEPQSKLRNKRYAWYQWVRSKQPMDLNNDLQDFVNLISKRLLLADKVAVAKWDTNTPVEDPPREKIILQNVVKQAETTGLDPIWATIFFRDQIEANKDIQNGLIAKWRQQGHRPDGPAVDLQKEVRPLIDQINMRLIELSNKTKRLRTSWYCRSSVEQDARYATFLFGLDYLHQKALQRAISHFCVNAISKL